MGVRTGCVVHSNRAVDSNTYDITQIKGRETKKTEKRRKGKERAVNVRTYGTSSCVRLD